jgi:hypothetical protein
LGQQLFDRNKPLTKYSPAGTNDMHVRYCDPYGFPPEHDQRDPRDDDHDDATRTFILLQYMDLWREIWTDGRTLPTNVGGRGRDTLDPKYNGYSIGHWEDDYTFVVETTGSPRIPGRPTAAIHTASMRTSRNAFTATARTT